MGLFLALFATAHLVPRLQEKGTIDLYLSRPIGRVSLLLSRYAGGLLLAAANVALHDRRDLADRRWKTQVFHPRFLLSGIVILFTIATLMAFAFLVGVITSSTAVSLMGTYAVFFLAAILPCTTQISAAVSTELAAAWSRASTGSCPRRPSSGKATVALVAGDEAPARLAIVNPLAIYGSTALFGVASLGLASWLFSRKDF